MFGTAQTTVVVHINDVNEPPEFLNSHYTTVVSEGAGMGELLFSGIVAFDRDEVSYCIMKSSVILLGKFLPQCLFICLLRSLLMAKYILSLVQSCSFDRS